MKIEDLGEWRSSFETVVARLGRYFYRREPREQVGAYIRGLVARIERKNGWQLSEAMGQSVPDRMQDLLSSARWDEDGVRDELVHYVVENMGEPEGILILDETGFIKCGDQSVGVQRQYSGTAGKVENCQVGVFLGYSSGKGHALLDRRLYLPESWDTDDTRREKAQVPAEVHTQTKPKLGLEMVLHAVELAVPFEWVTADEVYGDNPTLRDGLFEAGIRFVMAISKSTYVYLERPEVELPPAVKPKGQRGCGRTRPRLAEGATPAVKAETLVASLPAELWSAITVAAGEKGLITYDWVALRVVESRSRSKLPGYDLWLLVRRSQSDPSELAYYFSNAATDVSVEVLAHVAARRFVIEQCFREAKQDAGLDEYEVRKWCSWHRHITLSMLALAWLSVTRHQAQEKGGSMNPTWLRSPFPRSGVSSSSHSTSFNPIRSSSSTGLSTAV